MYDIQKMLNDKSECAIKEKVVIKLHCLNWGVCSFM